MALYEQEQDFVSFVRLNRSAICRVAYTLCNDWHEADDLTQATLTKLFERWRWLNDRHKMWNYARRVLYNSFVAERRRSRWQNEILQSEIVDRGVFDHASIEERLVLADALNQLGPRQREVVLLRYVEDLSIKQTATILCCSPGTVSSQASRAIQALRSILGEGIQ